MARVDVDVVAPTVGIALEQKGCLIETINDTLSAHGRFTIESTLLHTSQAALPVMMHMKLK